MSVTRLPPSFRHAHRTRTLLECLEHVFTNFGTVKFDDDAERQSCWH